MDRNGPPNQTPPEEIDLGEFVRALWNDKWLIIAITIVVTCITGAYALLASPVYEATVRMLPPTASGLASYNAASQLTGSAISGMLDTEALNGIEAITPDNAYSAFLTQLNSNTVKKKFFDEYYQPLISKQDKAVSTQQLWRRLNEAVTIERPKPGEDVAALTLEGHDPKLTASWANQYVDLAIDSTKNELLENLRGEIQVRSTGIEDQLAALRSSAKQSRESQIIRVRNALSVAESIGLESPSESGPLISIDNRKDMFVNGGLMYLRGAKALRSELNLLQKRDNDDAYIAELPDLLKKQTLLQKIDLKANHLSVARIDSVAQVPENPIKPRKAILVLLGLVVGAFLAVCFSLIRLIFSKTK